MRVGHDDPFHHIPANVRRLVSDPRIGGVLIFSYADDVYMGGAPVSVALALVEALDLYGIVGLQQGWGPKKTEQVLPHSCDPVILPLPHDHTCKLLLDEAIGFKACRGVPRHPTNEDSFIDEALEPVARRHDNLLDPVVVVSDEDPFAALRLLQVCGVNKSGHILSGVLPDSSTAYTTSGMHPSHQRWERYKGFR